MSPLPGDTEHYMPISERPQTSKPQQIFKLFALHRVEVKAISFINNNFPENPSDNTIYIVPMNIKKLI